MHKDKKEKIINIVKYVSGTFIVLGILIVLFLYIYSFNSNYRKYEFKLTDNVINLSLGKEGFIPIVSAGGKEVNVNDYIFTSSDNSIISVTEDGKIIANKSGDTVIIIKAKRSNQKEILNVHVVLTGGTILIEDILIKDNILNIKVGDSYSVNYEIVPNGAFIDNIVWSSSNTSVVSVDKGIIVGKSVGSCTVYIKSGNINKEITVNVSK